MGKGGLENFWAGTLGRGREGGKKQKEMETGLGQIEREVKRDSIWKHMPSAALGVTLPVGAGLEPLVRHGLVPGSHDRVNLALGQGLGCIARDDVDGRGRGE